MKYKKIIIYSLMTLTILAIPNIIHAQQRSFQDILTQGLIRPPAANGIYEISDIYLLLAAILRLLFSFSAIIAVIYIIIGGYNYVMAYGNPETAQKGKQTLLWAIIGLIVSIAAFTLVQFVWNTVASRQPPSPTASTSTSISFSGGTATPSTPAL